MHARRAVKPECEVGLEMDGMDFVDVMDVWSPELNFSGLRIWPSVPRGGVLARLFSSKGPFGGNPLCRINVCLAKQVGSD
jgi:hypothetical protein